MVLNAPNAAEKQLLIPNGGTSMLPWYPLQGEILKSHLKCCFSSWQGFIVGMFKVTVDIFVVYFTGGWSWWWGRWWRWWGGGGGGWGGDNLCHKTLKSPTHCSRAWMNKVRQTCVYQWFCVSCVHVCVFGSGFNGLMAVILVLMRFCNAV